MKNDLLKKTAIIAGFAGAGAAIVYLLDPEHGKRRRARVRDKATHFGVQARKTLLTCGIDLGNKLEGAASVLQARLCMEKADDQVIAARVRSRLGHVVSHPHAVEVIVSEGVVTLYGPVLESEEPKAVREVRGITGVTEVRNRLHTHKNAGGIPALQTGLKPGTHVLQPLPARWSPAMRLGIGMAGVTLAGLALRKRNWAAPFLGAAGTGLLLSATTNRSLHKSLGFEDPWAGLRVRRSISIAAPISELYKFWSDPLNYASVFSHVVSIEKVSEDSYLWTVEGPAGKHISWQGRIIDRVPNQLVAWTTDPESQLPNSGIVSLEPIYDGSTHLQVTLDYRPPAGVLGQFIAKFLGADPAKTLEQDLLNLKRKFEASLPKKSQRDPLISRRASEEREWDSAEKMATT